MACLSFLRWCVFALCVCPSHFPCSITGSSDVYCQVPTTTPWAPQKRPKRAGRNAQQRTPAQGPRGASRLQHAAVPSTTHPHLSSLLHPRGCNNPICSSPTCVVWPARVQACVKPLKASHLPPSTTLPLLRVGTPAWDTRIAIHSATPRGCFAGGSFLRPHLSSAASKKLPPGWSCPRWVHQHPAVRAQPPAHTRPYGTGDRVDPGTTQVAMPA